MSYGRYQTAQLQTALGFAVPGAQVYFLTQPANPATLTPLATVYADAEGDEQLTQPLLTDGFGEFAAYLSPGVYTVVYISEYTGTLIYPDQNIAVGGGTPGSTTFDEIGSGTNTTAAMVVGTGASLEPAGTGTIEATAIDGVSVTGTPSVGQTIVATSPTAATWQVPPGGVTSINSLTGAIVFAAGSGLALSVSGNTLTFSIATSFAITSFTGGQTVEVGASIVNPTFNATYTTTPTSAQITNTAAIDSPLALSSPFTSGTLTGTFTYSTPTNVTVTLSAESQTATQTLGFQDAIFGGVGATGATSSVTASGTTAVLSTGDALPRLQLGAEAVDQEFGPFTPNPSTGQTIYLLLTGGSHTFVDVATGAPFAMAAPISVSFVNAHGATVSMFLYGSLYPQYLPYTLKVAS